MPAADGPKAKEVHCVARLLDIQLDLDRALQVLLSRVQPRVRHVVRRLNVRGHPKEVDLALAHFQSIREVLLTGYQMQ